MNCILTECYTVSKIVKWLLIIGCHYKLTHDSSCHRLGFTRPCRCHKDMPIPGRHTIIVGLHSLGTSLPDLFLLNLRSSHRKGRGQTFKGHNFPNGRPFGWLDKLHEFGSILFWLSGTQNPIFQIINSMNAIKPGREKKHRKVDEMIFSCAHNQWHVNNKVVHVWVALVLTFHGTWIPTRLSFSN